MRIIFITFIIVIINFITINMISIIIIIVDINDRFGKVNNRRKRADLFLPYENEKIQIALKEAVGNLSPLLLVLDDMEKEGILYENTYMFMYFGR